MGRSEAKKERVKRGECMKRDGNRNIYIYIYICVCVCVCVCVCIINKEFSILGIEYKYLS